MDDIYRVCVRGHLDDRWSDWFGGMAVQRQADGTTVLVGPVVDQAALHGVIARIRDLGLPLLSVRRVVDAHSTARRDVRGRCDTDPRTDPFENASLERVGG